MVTFLRCTLSLGSWLWYSFGNARATTELPMVPSEVGLRDMMILLMYGFVEQGLEHRASITTMVFCMMFCTIVILSYFCWKAQRTEKERASELVELQKLCDAFHGSGAVTVHPRIPELQWLGPKPQRRVA